MTIVYIKKDITSVERGIVAHGVNCRGAMGSGVAKAIRNKWPEIFPPYHQLCVEHARNADTLLGHVQLIDLTNGDETLMVANIFTQLDYGRGGIVYADVIAVMYGLVWAVNEAKSLELPLYLPRIGCGLGGLDWEGQVAPILEQLNSTHAEIYVCDL